MAPAGANQSATTGGNWGSVVRRFSARRQTSREIGQRALRESLEISGFIQQQMLMASNFGLCATVNGQFIVKAPDWVYIERVNQELGDCATRSQALYTKSRKRRSPSRDQIFI
ncbi:hypothetical protein [Gloeocapsopsis sp. IPPAS B-1203]|uniref:hypothetical protein n=1 Tax=Gloeocapsopsis sp. IPPAS B-1203 TaxID=2049454 RepID=UPI0025A25416|nr:hypothetical protein [Gloeocapsopsis sp. IPPAS B-1203]